MDAGIGDDASSLTYPAHMEWIWIAIAVLTAPAAVLVLGVCNPISILLLGRTGWQGWLARFYEYRWTLVGLTVAFALSIAVIGVRYG